MSGKISANSGFVTKADFMRLQSRVETLATRLAEARLEASRSAPPTITPASTPANHRKLTGGVKSWLTSKAGSSTPRSSLLDVSSTCQNCGKAGSTEVSGHEQTPDTNKRIFQKRGRDDSRERIDNQRCTKNEFNQLQADVTKDIKSLQNSVRDLQLLCDDLEKSFQKSLVSLQVTVDRLSVQVVASNERLDQLSSHGKERPFSRSELTGTITKQKGRHF